MTGSADQAKDFTIVFFGQGLIWILFYINCSLGV